MQRPCLAIRDSYPSLPPALHTFTLLLLVDPICAGDAPGIGAAAAPRDSEILPLVRPTTTNPFTSPPFPHTCRSFAPPPLTPSPPLPFPTPAARSPTTTNPFTSPPFPHACRSFAHHH
eukprot:352956-Chlamydomonas_euryale.AAC.1